MGNFRRRSAYVYLYVRWLNIDHAVTTSIVTGSLSQEISSVSYLSNWTVIKIEE